MLSRVADNLYWMARYLERTENLARLVDVSAGLMLDLPQRLSPGWQPLIKITGNESLYADHERDYSEKSVVKFIVANAKNPGSMLTSIARAREIARTVRDILPREVWEQINELYLYVAEHAAEACARRTRYGFLDRGHQRARSADRHVRGHLQRRRCTVVPDPGPQHRTRRHDQPHRGRARRGDDERAERGGTGPFETVLWMGVLRSLSGYQMYRLKTRERVYGAGVVRFLLADEQFPRACVCCLRRAEDVLHRLPNSQPLLRRVSRMRRAVHHTRFESLQQGELHEFIDRLQVLAGPHQ